MAYLLINKKENIVIDKIGENIYLRNFPPRHSQKANIVGKSKFNDYCACLDPMERVHLVYKTSANSIIHLLSDGINYSTDTLLEDVDDTYKICNLALITHTENYLFYSAKNPYENTNDLIFHKFTETEESSPQALLSLPKLTSKYQCILVDDFIYVLCCIFNEEQYELNLYQYNTNSHEWEGFESLVISEYPITDFSIAMQKKDVHITYVIEKFGHSSLYYGQRKEDNFLSLEIDSMGKTIKPTLFMYNNIIWINYIIGNSIFYSFSCDGGNSFSKTTKCTLQHTSLDSIYLSTFIHSALHGNEFFGFIDHQPNVAVLSQIDMDQILYNSSSNKELKDMITTIANPKRRKIPPHDEVKKLKEENTKLRQLQQSITEQYNELSSFAKEVQAEGKKWRKKYNKLNREVKAQKEVQAEVQTKQDNDE